MKYRRFSGIVLSVNSFGESDKLVTLYCADVGLIKTIAKGAKRSKKRFVNKLEPFSMLDIICRPPRGNGLFLLLEAELDRAFLSLRSDHRLYTTATYMVELLLRFSREQERDPNVFPLLAWALTTLEQDGSPFRIAVIFQLRLLSLAGYQPALDSCCRCGVPVNARRFYTFEPGRGALVCTHCQGGPQDPALALSLQSLRFMQVVLHSNLEKINRFQLPRLPSRMILQVLHRYTVHILQRDINSFRFLLQVAA